MNKQNFAFIIPAYNPDEKLISVVKEILDSTHFNIFIINDGSKEETKKIFTYIKDIDLKRVIILEHYINLGKGAALKTAFNHILVNYPEIIGVVTLDSDGQHSIKDCIRVLEELEKNKEAFLF